ncbi:uncharacterized protein DNG_04230 [Cephalotrichum gorgonifer]|uniref:DUF7735 domain-containing protein n=1 Tax=Cephalotrichum gorgonifer TaxID=2041049 RepID=A0AAE8SUC1_9PEZI|nr:uncharacterized protein DNG_04230 [Cephalotrichum gorgonifer]
MKTTIVSLVYAVIAVSGSTLTLSDPVVFPTESPTGSPDPSKCATHNYGSLMNAPMPTGNLESALYGYAGQLFEACADSGTPLTKCIWPYPEMCGITTASPEVQSQFISYASVGSSWWAAHTSVIYSVAKECPHTWYDLFAFDGHRNAGILDTPLRIAKCLEEFPITTGDHAITDPTATSGPDAADGPEETGAAADDNAAGGAVAVRMSAVAAIGLGAAIMNAI